MSKAIDAFYFQDARLPKALFPREQSACFQWNYNVQRTSRCYHPHASFLLSASSCLQTLLKSYYVPCSVRCGGGKSEKGSCWFQGSYTHTETAVIQAHLGKGYMRLQQGITVKGDGGTGFRKGWRHCWKVVLVPDFKGNKSRLLGTCHPHSHPKPPFLFPLPVRYGAFGGPHSCPQLPTPPSAWAEPGPGHRCNWNSSLSPALGGSQHREESEELIGTK